MLLKVLFKINDSLINELLSENGDEGGLHGEKPKETASATVCSGVF